MPAESIIAISIITGAFALYAATLAWADYYTSRRQ